LLVNNDGKLSIGNPTVANASVVADGGTYSRPQENRVQNEAAQKAIIAPSAIVRN
jgi:hypothetical protein